MFCCGHCFSSYSREEVDLTKEDPQFGNQKLDQVSISGKKGKREPVKAYFYRRLRNSTFIDESRHPDFSKSISLTNEKLNPNGLRNGHHLEQSNPRGSFSKARCANDFEETQKDEDLKGATGINNEEKDMKMVIEKQEDIPIMNIRNDETGRTSLIAGNHPTRVSSSEDSDIDFNAYATRKNIALGILDIALLTANATQLKYVLQKGAPVKKGEQGTIDQEQSVASYVYSAEIVLILVSIGLQILVGIALFYNNRHNVADRRFRKTAEACNTLILLMIFVITVINVFIVVFIDGFRGQFN